MGFAVLGKGKFYGWITLSAAALVMCCMAGMLSFGVFLPSICKEFGWTRGMVAGAYTMIMMVMGFSSPLAGMFIAKHGAKRAIVIGNSLGVLGLLLLAFHKHLWQFYIGYGALIGLGIGFGGFIATTTISNSWFVKRRPLAISIVISSGGIGGLLLYPLIMATINKVGWRPTYVILSAFIFVFSVIVPGLLIRNKPEDLGQIPDGLSTPVSEETTSGAPTRQLYTTPVDFTAAEAFRTRAAWLLIGLGFVQTFILSMIMTHQVAFLIDMRISSEMAASALGLLPGVSIMGRLGVGFLGLRYNIQSLAIGSTVVMTIGMVLVLLTKSLPMVFAYTFVLGIGSGALTVCSISLVPTYFGKANYSKIVGFTTFFGPIGSIGAPIAGGLYTATGSYALPFTIGVLVLVAGIACAILATPPRHPSLTHE